MVGGGTWMWELEGGKEARIGELERCRPTVPGSLCWDRVELRHGGYFGQPIVDIRWTGRSLASLHASRYSGS